MFFSKKHKKITVNNNQISVIKVNGQDYICLTDMVRGEEGADHIKNWMRNRNTVEFLGLWEQLHNANFKGVEFDTFRKEAGLNSFTLTPKKWIDATNAIGMISKSGNGGGTYAQVDIAFEFGSWISPQFKLYLIKEYERLKAIETNPYNIEWNVKRVLSKANYTIHTDAIKEFVIPQSRRWFKDMEYAEEADFLNLAVFGMTAKEWRDKNKERAKKGENIRDSASINELLVITNLESQSAAMIRDGLDKRTRFEKLQEIASIELNRLNQYDFKKSLKRLTPETYLLEDKSKDLKG